jgi:S-disulfanyl-L-cysteine oxidoreductase SoxD
MQLRSQAKAYAAIVLLALGAAIAFAAETADQKPGDSRIWGGVYTAAQAQRGKENFQKSCSNCHNADLTGSVRAPSLKGDRFMRNWENGSANVLFLKLRDSMPFNYPETVPDEIKIDILAYLLQANGFPAGKGELKLDEKELEDIQIVQKGEQAAPNFALVRMVGCLTQGAGKSWILTRASEPIVTRDDTPAPAALKDAGSQAPGTGKFELLSTAAFNPGAHKGQKVEARGLLYRDAGQSLLNLTSLENAGGSCAE